MREIKFRGKDFFTGKWVFGSLIKNEVGDLFILTDKGDHRVVSETVCQFTCLLDYKGNEIYEGDIITSNTYPFVDEEGNQNYYGVIIWLEGGFVVETVRSAETTVRGISEGNVEHITDFLSRLPEVIGNIHDNTELLKEKK